MNRDPLNQGAPSGASNSTQQLPRSLSQSQLSSSSSYPPTSNSQRSDRTSPTAIASGASYFSPATFATTNPTTTAPTSASATTAPMATSALNSFHPFATMAPSYPSAGPRYPERDTTYTAGASLDGPPFTLIVHGLDANIDKNTLKYMFMAFSDLLISYDLLAPEGDGVLTRSAIVQTKTLESAYEVKQLFNNKNGLTVEIPGQGQISGQSSSGASSATSPSAAPTQAPRFESFSPLERTSPPNGNGARNGNGNGFNHGIFSPQSPIGNHLSTQPRMSGKSLIDATDDDDTEDILRATRAHTENGSLFPAPRALFPEYYSSQGARSYGENGLGPTQRRATAPQLPLAAHMASLSLKTSANGMPTAQHGNQAMYPQSAHSTTMSPTNMNGSLGNSHQSNYPGYERVLPPVNPADQNPPCNTLYVGNLPMDAQEDELRRIFQAARGYKRMCYRSKNNGPMCFVEFEDVGCATRAMNDMYGKTLSNSRKGGIRLSFSKNPLGVRNTPAPGSGSAGSMGAHHGMMGHATNGFAAANGPPPGLHPLPPGLNLNRSASSYAVSAMTNGSSMPMTNGPGLGVMTNGASYAPATGNGNSNGNSLGFALGNGSGYEQRGDQRREPRDTSRDPWPSNYSTNGFASPPAGGANGGGPFSPYGRVPRNSNF